MSLGEMCRAHSLGTSTLLIAAGTDESQWCPSCRIVNPPAARHDLHRRGDRSITCSRYSKWGCEPTDLRSDGISLIDHFERLIPLVHSTPFRPLCPYPMTSPPSLHPSALPSQQQPPLLRRHTHPQLPLPLLSLQIQPLNRITQPFLLLPHLLQPQHLPPLLPFPRTRFPIHKTRSSSTRMPRTTTPPCGGRAAKPTSPGLPRTESSFLKVAFRNQALLPPFQAVQVRIHSPQQRLHFWCDRLQQFLLRLHQAYFGEEFEMLVSVSRLSSQQPTVYSSVGNEVRDIPASFAAPSTIAGNHSHLSRELRCWSPEAASTTAATRRTRLGARRATLLWLTPSANLGGPKKHDELWQSEVINQRLNLEISLC